jgi:putative Holliday junction resolvase
VRPAASPDRVPPGAYHATGRPTLWLGGWGSRGEEEQLEEAHRVIVLALDVGAKRIGVATSDELELLASPHGVIRRQSTAQALDAVARAVAATRAELVVVGLPVSFDGQLHAQARVIQTFGEKLRRRLAVPVVYADETLSSVRAEEQLRAAGVREDRIRERLDAAAAAIILQEYLDQRRQVKSVAPSTPSQREGTSDASAGGAVEHEPGQTPEYDPAPGAPECQGQGDQGMEDTQLP